MGVGENPLPRRSTVHKREVGLAAPATQDEALPAVAWVVVHGLQHGSIRTYIPLRCAESVLPGDLRPPFVARFVSYPPQQLKIHHSVDDGVIAAHTPRCDQLRF